MGYTHYWYRYPADETAAMFERLGVDAMRIVQAAAFTGIGIDAEFTADYFTINGTGDGAHEEFYWPAVDDSDEMFDDGSRFHSCKTGERPYDAVVCAIILRAMMHYQPSDLSFSSDGTWAIGWAAGRDLYAVAFGHEFDDTILHNRD